MSIFWETTSGVFPCYSCWFGSCYMLRLFSTRCRASVGISLSVAVFAVFCLEFLVSSLSVAVLRDYSCLVSRRTVPVHRRCQGVFLHYFYGSSFLATTCSMSFWSTRYGIFWEIPSGNVPVFSAIWFDSGYMFASAHEFLSDKGVDMPVWYAGQFGPHSSETCGGSTGPVLGQVVDVPVVVQRQVRGSMVH